MREVRWERMFPDELEARFAACPVVYFAYGLCEPHGPQNAVGLDALKAHAIACRAARAHGGIVAPPDYWHIHELGGYAAWGQRAVGQVERTWLTAVPPWVHFKNICYHLRAADALGFHAAILLTGHYGPNWQDLKTLLELVQPHVGTRLYGLPDFEANQPGFAGDGNERRRPRRPGRDLAAVGAGARVRRRLAPAGAGRRRPALRHGRRRARGRPAHRRADGRRRGALAGRQGGRAAGRLRAGRTPAHAAHLRGRRGAVGAGRSAAAQAVRIDAAGLARPGDGGTAGGRPRRFGLVRERAGADRG